VRRHLTGGKPLIGAPSTIVDAFTGTGGNRSSRWLALRVRSLRLCNSAPGLRALLFLAPHQILAQRLGQPCFAGSSLETLFWGDAGRLAHSAMQRERRRAVKTSPTARRGFFKGLGRTRHLGFRAPRKPNSWKYKNNENRDCTGKTITPVFRIVCLINRLGINFRAVEQRNRLSVSTEFAQS